MHGGVHPREVGAPHGPMVARDGVCKKQTMTLNNTNMNTNTNANTNITGNTKKNDATRAWIEKAGRMNLVYGLILRLDNFVVIVVVACSF